MQESKGLCMGFNLAKGILLGRTKKGWYAQRVGKIFNETREPNRTKLENDYIIKAHC